MSNSITSQLKTTFPCPAGYKELVEGEKYKWLYERNCVRLEVQFIGWCKIGTTTHIEISRGGRRSKVLPVYFVAKSY